MNRTLSYFNQTADQYTQLTYHHRTRRILWKWMKEREREIVLKLLDPNPDDFILDAGCGAGYYLSLLAKNGFHAEGVDFSDKMVGAAKANGLSVSVANIEENLGGVEKYHKILCTGVLEFCKKDRQILVNLKHVLKSKGLLILLIPDNNLLGRFYQLFHKIFGCGEWINLYAQDHISTIAKSCGFRTNTIVSATPYTLAIKLCKISHDPK